MTTLQIILLLTFAFGGVFTVKGAFLSRDVFDSENSFGTGCVLFTVGLIVAFIYTVV